MKEDRDKLNENKKVLNEAIHNGSKELNVRYEIHHGEELLLTGCALFRGEFSDPKDNDELIRHQVEWFYGWLLACGIKPSDPNSCRPYSKTEQPNLS